MSPHSPASSARALPDTPITCDLPNLELLAARSAMNGQSLSVPHIIERCTALGTKISGGEIRVSIRLHMPFGSGGTRDTEVLSTQTE